MSDAFKNIERGLKEAIAHARGELFNIPINPWTHYGRKRVQNAVHHGEIRRKRLSR
jgi:hypothetical protein